MERYGALALAWLFLTYFGNADFGFGRSVTQRLASTIGRGDADRAANIVWTAIVTIAGFGILLALLLYVAARTYFAGPFDAAPDISAEMLAAVWLLALGSPIVALSGVLGGALMGIERFRLVASSAIIANSGALLFPLAIAYLYSVDLRWLILATLAARLLGLLLLASGVWQTFLRRAVPRFSVEEFRKLASYGAWIMVTAIVGPLMVAGDRMVIGAVLGAAAVAAYAIPFQIASRTLSLPIAIVQALFPRFASEDGEASRARCGTFTIVVAQIYTPLVIGLILLAGPLLSLWLGDNLDERSILVGQILMAGFWTNALANVPYAYIQARGQPRFTALLHLAELPFYIALLFGLGATFGLAGIAAAFALRCGIDMLALMTKAGAMGIDIWRKVAVQMALVLAALMLAHSIMSWAWLATSALALAALSLTATAWQMPPEIKAQLRVLLARFRKAA
ncbi:Membrane protein involved in the export of O-antigen and teichoic acid [Aurantiacibacter gangjinensis]|nr:Membrane protein involved in the export of O-antigen and teichoic acid [Aurantiacibacter gangjinensis]